jgi:hypothetical protein
MFTSAPTSTHRSSPRWRTSLVALAALAPVAALLAVAPTTATATPGPVHKVTICHRDNADTKPYVRETVDIASSGYLQAGHNGSSSSTKGHTGPVWNPTLKAAHIAWGDIIPPYTYLTSSGQLFTFAGYNWTTEGRAIYDNGCRPVTTTVVTPSAVATAATCTSDGMGSITVSPMTGATWTIDGTPVTTATTAKVAGDHTYVVVATAVSGSAFGDGKTTQTFSLTVAPATDCGSTEVIHVTPTAVAADPTCTSDGMGTITVSPMTGATWTIDGTPVTTATTAKVAGDHTYVVVATAESGYDFGEDATTKTFQLVLSPATDCGTTVVIHVTPTAAAADPTCTSDDMGTITVSPMTGATWTIDGTPVTTAVTSTPAADHPYVVVATAEPGYDFGDAVTTRTFGVVIAAAAGCGSSVVVPPTATEPTLAHTGDLPIALPTAAALALLLGFALIAATRRLHEVVR